MNRRLFLIALMLNIWLAGFTMPSDSVRTYYKNGEFITYCELDVKAPKSIMNEVVSDYIYQSKYDLDKLFEWALSDMKLRTEKDKLIVFNFKSTRYDKENDLIKGIGDVEVPGVVNFPNIHVDSRMTKAYLKNNKTRVRIEVMYSDAFLRKTTGVFYAMPENEQNSRISLETKVQFGWFFNIFITQSAFRSIMEWRFHQMMQNIRDEAERRYSLQQSTQRKVVRRK